MLTDHKITVLINNDISNLKNKNLETYKLNYDNIEKDIIYFKKQNFDGIIHLGAYYVRNHNPKDIRNIIDSNIKLGLHLLECGSICKIKFFINIGTFWQHFQNLNYSPVNLYSASKQAFESLSKYYVELKGLKFITLKINDSYGPNDNRNKILNIFDNAIINNNTLSMSPGNQLINILYIDDIISGIMILIQSNNKFKPGSEYILKSRNSITIREFADVYMSVRKVKLKINWGSLKYNDREMFVPFDRGIILPGWKEKYDLYTGLQKYLKYKNLFID